MCYFPGLGVTFRRATSPHHEEGFCPRSDDEIRKLKQIWPGPGGRGGVGDAGGAQHGSRVGEGRAFF